MYLGRRTKNYLVYRRAQQLAEKLSCAAPASHALVEPRADLAAMHRRDEQMLPCRVRPDGLAKNDRARMRRAQHTPGNTHSNAVWPQQLTALPKPWTRPEKEPRARMPCKHVASQRGRSSLAAPLGQVGAHEHVNQLFQLVGPHECCACGRQARLHAQAPQASGAAAVMAGSLWRARSRGRACRLRRQRPLTCRCSKLGCSPQTLATGLVIQSANSPSR